MTPKNTRHLVIKSILILFIPLVINNLRRVQINFLNLSLTVVFIY